MDNFGPVHVLFFVNHFIQFNLDDIDNSIIDFKKHLSIGSSDVIGDFLFFLCVLDYTMISSGGDRFVFSTVARALSSLAKFLWITLFLDGVGGVCYECHHQIHITAASLRLLDGQRRGQGQRDNPNEANHKFIKFSASYTAPLRINY